MEAIKNIKERRSIRRYISKPVPADLLRQVVEAAAYAPSWTNSQTVSYLALYDPEVRKRVDEKVAEVSPHNGEILKNVPLLVLQLSENGKSGIRRASGKPIREGMDQHWQSFDAGLSAEAFCLAAHDYGLGTLILGGYAEDMIREVLELPENMKISCLLAVGYPEVVPDAPKRKSAEELLQTV